MAQTGRGMFAYPWTLAEQGIEQSIRYLSTELHTDNLYVSVNYHSGRLFQPLSHNKVNMRHDSTFSFAPDPERYPGNLELKVDEGVVGLDLQRAIRRTCIEYGVAYHAWAIGMHSSAVGRANPEWCVRNAYGDVYDYALCPNHPKSQAYMSGLIEDICANLAPKSVVLESPGFLGFVHGHHHEKMLSRLGPVCEYLLSLCFCSNCMHRAASSVVDVDRLQELVKLRVDRLCEQERGGMGMEFTQAEFACLLLEEPELYRYTMMRMETVTELLARIKSVAHRYGVELWTMPALIASNSWSEGSSLSQLAPVVDGFMALTYYSDPAKVRADLDWLKLFIGDTPYVALFNGGAPATNSASDLRSGVDTALRQGAKGVAYYNMSMLTRSRLEWIGSVNKEIG